MAGTHDDDDLRMLLQRVARRIRRNRSDEDVTDSQLGVLFRLQQVGGLSPGQLAEQERISPPSMNRTLNGLEAAGLVERHPDGGDARRVRVTLTPAGRTLIAETRALRSAWFSERVAELTPDERQALDAAIPVLRRLADE